MVHTPEIVIRNATPQQNVSTVSCYNPLPGATSGVQSDKNIRNHPLMGNSRGAWIRFGGLAGLLTVTAHLCLTYRLLPLSFGRVMLFVWPAGGILFVVGLGHLLRRYRNGFIVEAATLSGIIGFSLMSISAGSAVSAGADPVFGLFLQWSVLLFAAAMIGDSRFGRVFGISGCASAAAMLALGVYSSPRPPEVRILPVVLFWLMAVAFRMLMLSYVAAPAAARVHRKTLANAPVRAAVVE